MINFTKKSIYKLGVIAFLGMAGSAIAQTQDYSGKVGINTESPNATLDITAKVADGSKIEGLKTPQLTGDALKVMTAQLTANNDGLVVFVTSAVTTPDVSTEAVTLPGYYRFNFATHPSISVSQGKSFYTAKSWVRLEPTGLEIVKEGDKMGRRLVGTNPERYANIGTAAIDLSFQNNGTTDGGASGNYSFAIGVGTKATNTRSFAGGQDNIASGGNAVAIVGYKNTASGSDSFAGGNSSIASGTRSFSFGNKTQAKGTNAIAFGEESIAEGLNSSAFGYKTQAKSERSVVFGDTSFITDTASRNSVAMGVGVRITNSPNSLAYGANSVITNSDNAFAGGGGGTTVEAGASSIALGNAVKVKGAGSIGLGSLVEVNGPGSVALGANAKVGTFTGTTEITNGIAIGASASVTGEKGVAIGADATAGANEVAIGNGAASSVILGKLKSEALIAVDSACTENGRLSYNGTDFLGCTGGKWVKLNNQSGKQLETETIEPEGKCTEKGKIAYDGTDFFGCTGEGIWRFLN